MVKTKVNKTQLNAYDEAEREDPQIHRDQFAHWLRWQYVMKRHRVKLTKMTRQQADYIGFPVEGPYKPDYYRY